ncbi:MAG: Hint domain-containing protein [Rhodobacteraceae bacterium]|nr:Hint domain-containing protein [Paracoccaceae bacterium]
MTYTPGSAWSRANKAKPFRNADDGRDTAENMREAHLLATRRMAAAVDKVPAARNGRYHVAALLDNSEITDFDHRAPAELFLEDICANFARGTLIATEQGPVAVEDLMPGDRVKTRDGNGAAIRWIGSCMLDGNALVAEDYPLRIKADALGELRPVQDLIVGPRFRILTSHPGCAALFDSAEALAPVADLFDGDTIVRLRPPEDFEFFNLMCDGHQIIEANGLDTETYHPGDYGVTVMSLEVQSHLRRLFPHLDGDLHRFGRTIRPVLKGFEAEALRYG